MLTYLIKKLMGTKTFESEGLLIVAIYIWLPPASYVVFLTTLVRIHNITAPIYYVEFELYILAFKVNIALQNLLHKLLGFLVFHLTQSMHCSNQMLYYCIACKTWYSIFMSCLSHPTIMTLQVTSRFFYHIFVFEKFQEPK